MPSSFSRWSPSRLTPPRFDTIPYPFSRVSHLFRQGRIQGGNCTEVELIFSYVSVRRSRGGSEYHLATRQVKRRIVIIIVIGFFPIGKCNFFYFRCNSSYRYFQEPPLSALSLSHPLASFHVRRNPRLYSRAFAPFTLIPGVCNGEKSMRYVAYFWNSHARAIGMNRANNVCHFLGQDNVNPHSYEQNLI